MNNKPILAGLLILCIPTMLCAQKVKLVAAVHMAWSGGIAGRSGDNYTFTVEFTQYKKEPLPDTLWLGQEAILVTEQTNSNPYTNTRVIRKKGSVRFEISGQVTRDESAYSDPESALNEGKVAHPSPIGYKGIALLSYTCNGKRHYFPITRITRELPPADYP